MAFNKLFKKYTEEGITLTEMHKQDFGNLTIDLYERQFQACQPDALNIFIFRQYEKLKDDKYRLKVSYRLLDLMRTGRAFDYFMVTYCRTDPFYDFVTPDPWSASSIAVGLHTISPSNCFKLLNPMHVGMIYDKCQDLKAFIKIILQNGTVDQAKLIPIPEFDVSWLQCTKFDVLKCFLFGKNIELMKSAIENTNTYNCITKGLSIWFAKEYRITYTFGPYFSYHWLSASDDHNTIREFMDYASEENYESSIAKAISDT